MRSKSKILIAVIVFILAGVVFAGRFLLFTTAGVDFACRLVLLKFALTETVTVGSSEGTLFYGGVFRDVEVRGISGMPPGTVVKIQELEYSGIRSGALTFNVRNGRLLADEEMVMFYGAYRSGRLNFNIYANSFSARSLVLALFPDNPSLQHLEGKIQDIDFYLMGTPAEPRVSGRCVLKEARFRGFSAFDFPCSLRVNVVRTLDGQVRLYGALFFQEGEIRSRDTLVSVMESSLRFSGDPANPAIEARGYSVVDGTRITIAFSGTLEVPDLQLTSQPPMSQDKLIVMLMTGKSWTGTEQAVSKGQVTPEMVSDFVDYFLLGGSGERLIRKLGITDLTLTYEERVRGVEVKKSLTGSTNVIYDVQQVKNPDETPTTRQKLGLEYRLTETLSIEGRRELKQQPAEDEAEALREEPPESEVRLRYRRQF